MTMVEIVNGTLSKEEMAYYEEYAKKEHPLAHLHSIEVDGDYVNLIYKAPPFERIRRITGYLVGTLDRWNDAKYAEEHDRVKHSIDITDSDKFEE